MLRLHRPTSRLLTPILLTATLLLSSALAAPVQLTPIGTKDEFALLGQAPIQYTYDQSQLTMGLSHFEGRS